MRIELGVIIMPNTSMLCYLLMASQINWNKSKL